VNPNRNVIALSVTTFWVVFTLFSWLYLLPVYLKELGATDAHLGVAYSIFGLGFTIMQALGGILSDRLGRKRLIVYPTYLMPVCFLVVAQAGHWLVAAALFFVSNVLTALQMPSFMSMIHESSQRKGRAFGLFEFFIMLGIASGSLVGSFLVKGIGIRWLIRGTAAISLVAAVVRHALLRETLNHARHEAGSLVERFSLRLIIDRHRKWILFAAIFLFLAFSITVYGPFLTLFQEEVLRFGEDRINLFFAIGGFLSALGSLVGGRLSDHFGARIVLALSLLLHTLLLLIWSLSGGFLALFVLSFSFSQFCHVSYYTLITQSSRERFRGRVVGVFGTVTGAFSALGPFVAMQLKLTLGHWAPFALATLFAASGSLALLGSRAQQSLESTGPRP
jgi:MFS family permease